MGAGGSKPEGPAAGHYVFSSTASVDQPLSFSQEVIDSLQSSPETDASRRTTQELHIAQRVAAELEKLHAREAESLAKIRSEIASSPPPPKPDRKSTLSKAAAAITPSSLQSNQQDSSPRLLSLPSSPLPAAPSPTASAAAESTSPPPSEAEEKDLSRDSVSSQLATLRETLAKRKQVAPLPKDVEAAREGLIGCLRINDRRPLDCWQEVSEFREAVGKMEEGFVGSVL
ncbi:MAG: hypothetical protein Q9227_008021 [Pyrenula ochraceoflavens]